MKDDDEELNRVATSYALIICVVALALLILAENVAAEEYRWHDETVKVYHDPEGSVVPTEYAETAIKWAISRWNYADGDVRFEYAGETSIDWKYNALVVAHEALPDANGRFRYWWRDRGSHREIERARIIMSTENRFFAGDCWYGTLLHEFGHAVAPGSGHHDGIGVMYTSSFCNTTLTAEDLLHVGAYPCQITMPKGYDLHFAGVWDGVGTVEAHLAHIDGDGWDGWRIDRVRDVEADCGRLSQYDGQLVFTVWSRSAVYRVWLEPEDDFFMLTRAIVVE